MHQKQPPAIVAVSVDFDVGAQDGFEWVEDRGTCGDLAEDGVIAAHDLGEANGGAVGAADDGLDFVFEVGPNSGLEVFYGFLGERVRQFEETVVAEKADLFWSQEGGHALYSDPFLAPPIMTTPQ